MRDICWDKYGKVDKNPSRNGGVLFHIWFRMFIHDNNMLVLVKLFTNDNPSSVKMPSYWTWV